MKIQPILKNHTLFRNNIERGKVKNLAMRFDQASSGRQQVENTDKEYFRRQPQTEDNPSDMLTSV